MSKEVPQKRTPRLEGKKKGGEGERPGGVCRASWGKIGVYEKLALQKMLGGTWWGGIDGVRGGDVRSTTYVTKQEA